MRIKVLEALASDSGQSSIDFIFGFGMFLITFIFAISFVAGMFLPFQPGAIDLSSVAYRTSAILVEDPGWYIGANGTPSGTISWETFYNITDLESNNNASLRIGLAKDKTMPDILSIDKINAFQSLALENYSVVRNSLGLNASIVYNFNISLIMNTTFPSTTNGTQKIKNETLLNITSPTLPGDNVEILERNVMVDTGGELFLNCSNTQGGNGSALQWVNMSKLTVNDTDNITIRIYNAQGHIQSVGWSNNGLNFSHTWIYGDDYMVYLNGNPVYGFDPNGVTINSTDILEIVIFNSVFRDPLGNLNTYTKYVGIKANPDAMFPGGSINYFNDPEYKLMDVYYPAELQTEIWSYEFT